MTKSFKKILEATDTDHYRVLEKDKKLIKRKFKSDNTYVDVPLEDDLYALNLGFEDFHH